MRLYRPAAPGQTPQLVPGVGWGGPLPRRLCALLFGEAQADVVNLNCFLIRLSPLPGWVSSARNLDCITTTPPGTWPRTGRSWSGRGWMLGQPPRSCQLGDGTCDGWSLALVTFHYRGRMGGIGDWPSQEPRSTAGAGRSLESHSLIVDMPSLSQMPSSCLRIIWKLV